MTQEKYITYQNKYNRAIKTESRRLGLKSRVKNVRRPVFYDRFPFSDVLQEPGF